MSYENYSFDQTVQYEDMIQEGFTDTQANEIISLGLIDPGTLGEEDLSSFWETYRALYE